MPKPADFSTHLIQLRRNLHAAPEVGLHLPNTQRTLLSELDDLPLEITLGRECSSITAVLRGTHPDRNEQAPAVLLRSDMDALPVEEAAENQFVSNISGSMHACGHDLHMAMLVGAAQLLSARRHELLGDIVFMFQPGEEGWGGAQIMISEGVLTAAGPEVSSAFGVHVFTGEAAPTRVGIRSGTAMAYAAALTVDVIGQGGHGSAPHLASDPVPTAAEIILALQTTITRRFDPLDPVVLTVGQVSAGTARNVIAERVSFAATVRGFSRESLARATEILPKLVQGIAAAHGQVAEIDFVHEFPPLITQAEDSAIAIEAGRAVFGAPHVAELERPKTASEDFAEILERVPGTFAFIDATPEAGSDYNHSPRAQFDDAVIPDGARLYTEFAARRLTQLCADQTAPRHPASATTAEAETKENE